MIEAVDYYLPPYCASLHKIIIERERVKGKEENKKKERVISGTQKSICATGLIKAAVRNNDNVHKRDIYLLRKRFYTIIIFALMFVRFKYCYKHV